MQIASLCSFDCIAYKFILPKCVFLQECKGQKSVMSDPVFDLETSPEIQKKKKKGKLYYLYNW